MTHARTMDKFHSVQELFRHSKDGRWIEVILVLAVVGEDSVDRRAKQLKYKTLVDSIGSMVGE